MAGLEEKDKNEELEESKVAEDQTDEGSGDNADSKKSQKKDEGKKEKTFTQEQINAMMTREKNQGRNAALKELGIDPKDQKAVSMVKAFMDSQKSDEEKTLEKQNEENAKLKEVEQRALIAEAKAEAMQAGVNSQYVEDLVTLILAKKTDDSDVKALIGEFKTKYPVWFEKTDESKENIGKKGTGSSIKADGKGKGKEEKSLGATLAAQRIKPQTKKSYWS